MAHDIYDENSQFQYFFGDAFNDLCGRSCLQRCCCDSCYGSPGFVNDHQPELTLDVGGSDVQFHDGRSYDHQDEMDVTPIMMEWIFLKTYLS